MIFYISSCSEGILLSRLSIAPRTSSGSSDI